MVSADNLLTRQCCVPGSQLASNSATLYQKKEKKGWTEKKIRIQIQFIWIHNTVTMYEHSLEFLDFLLELVVSL